MYEDTDAPWRNPQRVQAGPLELHGRDFGKHRVTGFFSRRTTVAELRSPLTARQICEHAGIAYAEARAAETNR
jgi:hypothetical protein